MNSLILVMLGGAIGAGLRHLVGLVTIKAFTVQYPVGTLSVNVVGSLMMGVLAGLLARYGGGGQQWRLFLGVGVLGGFTTFSSFSLEAYAMFMRGQMLVALGYVLISVIASIGALAAGLSFVRAFA